MNTLIPLPGATAATGRAPSPPAMLWRDGALLEAIVRGRGPANTTEIQIGGHRVQARGGEGLRPGQPLTLQVSLTRDQVLLRLVTDRPAAQINQAVRETLPGQTGQPSLLANLALLTRAPAGTGTASPMAEMARNLLATLPDKAAVTRPDSLQRAIRDSGVFLESRLAGQLATGQRAVLTSDWKAALMRAADALRSMAARAAASTPTRTPAAAPPGAAGRAPAGQPATPGQAASTAASANSATASSGASTGASTTATAASTGAPAPAPTAGQPRSPATPTPPLPGSATPPATAAATADGQRTRTHGPPAPAAGTRAAPSPAVMPEAAAPPLRGGPPAAQPRSSPTLVAAEPRAAMTELATQLGGVLSRLSLSQLASLPADPAATNAWLVELPVRVAPDETDVLQFLIEREAATEPGAADPWSVDLSFDFPATGPVQARITVRGERVTTLFWAQRESTAAAFQSELADLQSRLEHRGLEVAGLGCRTGQPPAPARQAGGLVQTRA